MICFQMFRWLICLGFLGLGASVSFWERVSEANWLMEWLEFIFKAFVDLFIFFFSFSVDFQFSGPQDIPYVYCLFYVIFVPLRWIYYRFKKWHYYLLVSASYILQEYPLLFLLILGTFICFEVIGVFRWKILPLLFFFSYRGKKLMGGSVIWILCR